MNKNIVIYFSDEISPTSGGVERVASIMFYELSKRGYNIYILYSNRKHYKDAIPNQIHLPSEDAISEENIRFIENFLKTKNISSLINLAAIFNKSSRCVIEGCIRANVPHIAVYHNTLEMVLWSNRFFRRLMHYTILQSGLRYMLGFIQRFPYYKGANYIYRNSSDAIVLANSYIPMYHKLISRDKSSKVQAIYNPLSISIPTINLTEKKNIALFVGRLEKQKNLQTLLKAWAIASLTGWELKIVGTGQQEQCLKDLCVKLGISNTVSFYGHQPPERYYHIAKVFCMTSLFEGFPMTLIECQAYGCVPIITNSYPAASEIVKNEYNGILVSTNDAVIYANKLRALTSSDSQLLAMANEAIKFSRIFDTNSIIKQWDKLLSKYTIV